MTEKTPAPEPLDETDAGSGVEESADEHNANDFRAELAALREHTSAKRRRLS